MSVQRTFTRQWRFLLFFFNVLLTVCPVIGYNVLIVSGFASRSHRHVFDEVAESLAKRGNNVTFLSAIKEIRPIAGVTSYHLTESENIMNDGTFSFFQGDMNDPVVFERALQMSVHVCEAAIRHPAYQKLLNQPRGSSTFDVIVIDQIFNDCHLALAHHLGLPSVFISPSIALYGTVWHMNIPYPHSYLTLGFDDKSTNLNFLERAYNAFELFSYVYHRDKSFLPQLDELVNKYMPGTPPIAELERNVSMLLTNTHKAVYPSAPSMPYSMEVGCLNCKEAKKLPKDLDDFLSSSGSDGAIYFSLGTYAKAGDMPLETRNKFVEAFSKIPQKVLWKFEEDISDLPSNVKRIKWAPQQDILVHPKIRLFITHGGGLSMLEAAYHGVPLLGFPLAGDQLGNMAHATYRGYAESLLWRTFSPDDLRQLIHRMITEKRYKECAVKLSQIIKDNAVDPKEMAAYNIEYVARYKGAPHLKSGAEGLNMFQYLLLDVFGAALLVIVLILVIIFIIIRSLIQCFYGKKLPKNKKFQ